MKELQQCEETARGWCFSGTDVLGPTGTCVRSNEKNVLLWYVEMFEKK